MLTLLFLVATFLERAIEVYVITFRKKYKEIQQANNKDTTQYESETAQITLLAALAAGIIISMIGIRGIEPFINELPVKNDWQTSWFRTSDILLTGGVLAGGSDFIHKILQALTTFMDTIATANKSTEASNKANIAAEKTQEIASMADAAVHLKRLEEAQKSTL